MEQILFFEKVQQDPFKIDFFGNNWLMIALEINHSYFEKLLNANTIFTVVTSISHKNKNGDTIFDLVEKNDSTHHFKKQLQDLFLSEIEEKKLDINCAISNSGETLLLSTLSCENYETTLKILEKKEIDVSVIDKKCRSVATYINSSLKSYLNKPHIPWIPIIRDDLIKVIKKIVSKNFEMLERILPTLLLIDKKLIVNLCESIDLLLEEKNTSITSCELDDKRLYEILVEQNDKRINQTIKKLLKHPSFDVNEIRYKKSQNAKDSAIVFSPLTLALEYQNYEIIMAILEDSRCQSINHDFKYESPIKLTGLYKPAIVIINEKYIRVKHDKDIEIVGKLLERKDFNVNAIVDEYGDTLLLSALAQKKYKIVCMILERNDCNGDYVKNRVGILSYLFDHIGKYTTHAKIDSELIEVLKLTAKCKTYNPNNIIANDNMTLMHLIAFRMHYMRGTRNFQIELCDVIDIILDRPECNVNLIDSSNGTAFSYMTSLNNSRANQTIKKIIDHPKFDVNTTQCSKDTCILLAIYYKNFEIASTLVEKNKCSFYIKNCHNMHSIDYLMEPCIRASTRINFIKDILKCDIFNINIPLRNGNTVLIESAVREEFALTDFLLDQTDIKLDVDYTNDKSESNLVLVLVNKLIDGKYVMSILKKLINRPNFNIDQTINVKRTGMNSVTGSLLNIFFSNSIKETAHYEWLTIIKYEIIDALLDNPRCNVDQTTHNGLNLARYLLMYLTSKSSNASQNEKNRIYTSLKKLFLREDYYFNEVITTHGRTSLILLSDSLAKDFDKDKYELIDILLKNPKYDVNIKENSGRDAFYFLIESLEKASNSNVPQQIVMCTDLISKLIKRPDFDIKFWIPSADGTNKNILSHLYSKTVNIVGNRLIDTFFDAHINGTFLDSNNNEMSLLNYILANSSYKVCQRALSHPKLVLTETIIAGKIINFRFVKYECDNCNGFNNLEIVNLLMLLKLAKRVEKQICKSDKNGIDKAKTETKTETKYEIQSEGVHLFDNEKPSNESIPLLGSNTQRLCRINDSSRMLQGISSDVSCSSLVSLKDKMFSTKNDDKEESAEI